MAPKLATMVYSMTGYGRKEVIIDERTISIEIKTLNTKYFDVSFKLPSDLKFKEIEIRQFLSKELQRGKAECSINLGGQGKSTASQLNKSVLGLYVKQIQEFFNEIEVTVPEKEIVPHLIRLPEVFGADDDFWNKHWPEIKENLGEAVELAKKFRLQEGVILKNDLLERVASIKNLLERVEPFEQERIDRLRAKLNEQFNKVDSENKDRFEQEMIYYLERLDVSEEKVRLKAHCDYFLELLNDDVAAKGKRLNFVSQEMGREINTLGSKANHAEIQKLVILMKDELEKIKEQVLNIL